MYQLEGSVKQIYDIQTFPSGFSKREFVVSTDEKFPQDVKFECVKDKCALLDAIGKGDTVTVHFRIRGNEFKGKYYVNLQAYQIDSGKSSGTGGSSRDQDEPRGDASDGTPDDPFADEENPFF